MKLNNAYTEDYTPYDARGNRKAATGQYVYNDLNQLTETPTQQYTYDADGNLVEIGTKPCTGNYEKKVMTYDIDNRMVGFQHYPASSTTPDITASYIYDLYGRRLKKTVTQSGTTTVTNFMWSGDNIAYEMDENYAAIKKYLYEPGKIDSQFAVMCFPEMDDYHSNLNQFYTNYKGWYALVKDQVGTVIKVFDTSTGTFTETRHFDTFGNLLPGSTPSSDWKSSFGFQGKMLDQESGFYQFYNRYYSPEIGRFTTEDPVKFQGGRNFYAFAGNNPVENIDPEGLAYFAKRRLRPFPWLGPISCNNFPGNIFNLEISHEHLFFEDDKQPADLGFFHENGKSMVKPDVPGAGKYHCKSGHYNDCVMRKAVQQVGGFGDYDLIAKNCQDWAARVRLKYNELVQKV